MKSTVDIRAEIEISYKRVDNYIYQKIHIVPDRPNNIRYFTHPKYILGRKTEDFLHSIFIGDGENIMFVEKKEFKNTQTIKYRVDHEVERDLSDVKYRIEGKKPKFDGCLNGCQHLRGRNGQPSCAFFKTFLKKYKKSCQEYLEKG